MMKRAQSEIIGLAVIVIMVSIGIFLLISFSEEPESFHKGFSDEQTIKNLLTSMKRTTVLECRNLDIGELLVNCEEGLGKSDTLRTSGSADLCDTGTTCFVVNKTIAFLLNQTMNKQGLNFQLKAFRHESDRFESIMNNPDEWILNIKDNRRYGCDRSSDAKSVIQPIPYGFGKSLDLMLVVCE